MNKLNNCNCGNTHIDIFTQTDWDGDTEFVIMCQKCKKSVSASTKEQAINIWNNGK